MSFEKDLVRGQKIEKKILKYIQRKYTDAYIVNGYCKDWDIFIPSIDKGVEVKYDPMSQKTGNIVVEVSFNNKPSALSTTKAYRWVFYTGKEMIVTTPEKIRKTIYYHNLSPVEFVGPGDKYSKEAYLVKSKILKWNALLVKNGI